mmetsp:Transcript_20194/g.50247  ORF Transcript_20194/g.50247 Transcript_20194/m.50247 type:complete len:414 (-) Transcript_20194:157-1398(-)|eukprot:CAMPEP_0116078120 /NCGR_PEP_ID=MMETSP0327-20121206/429_1 /TAXON_ID=44447 /ORGANISM="Pseudo-nitzschia delicatissima, Strain B596" /LENGTH=413 /DNA_ID=CAMNT_0003568637 /DNA_START=106 /DNA_END=1347 /DNA_ORIENTATION=+
MGSAGEKKSVPNKTHNLEAPIPKKKKGKKIVAGNSLGVTSTENNQGVNNTSWQKGNYEIPRKPNLAVTPEKHGKSRWGKTKNGNNQFVKKRTDTRKFEVLATLPQEVKNVDAVRAALKSKSELPEKFRSAICDTTLELNEFRDFVIPRGSSCHFSYMKNVLQKCGKLGFLEWLQGWKGWIVETDKSPYLRYYRELHKVYDVKVRALMRKVDKDTKQKLRLLYYKDPLTLKNGRNGTQQGTNQQTLWKKVDEAQSLDAGVGMIRPFLEVVRYFCTDPREKWTSLPWLMPAISVEESRDRIFRISRIVFRLMRNSDWGPDTPVHWAAHPARNGYPLTVVTSETMTELVVGITNILSLLFLSKLITVSNLDQVDKMLSSPVWQKKAVRSSNRNPRAPSSDSVDDVVIDLTGLSIND